jgi:hypothetical protein
MARLQVVAKLFTSMDESEKFDRLSDDLGFVGPPGSLWTYADLHVALFHFLISWLIFSSQHPLLLKYNFDPENFFKGAKESFQNVYQIIQSQEFKDNLQE